MALIPASELAEFLLMPADIRREVETWSTKLGEVRPPIQRSLAVLAGELGVSVQTARRKYDAWRKQGWRGLVNRSKVADGRSNLAPEFVEYWKGLCQQNGRKCRPAYREFVRQFRAGAVIPGLAPATTRSSLPLGYSYANLIRLAPTRFELTAARIGRGAAADFRPKVFTTRVGLEVGQRTIFDDLWHDFEVAMLGQRSALRLLQLHAHDLFSGCQFARGLKPRVKNDDGTSVGLNQDEMLFLVCHVLTDFGFHPEGTVFYVEHGTAAISEALERVLFDVTAGKVRVDRSGIGGASAFAGQYVGRGKGNFRFKAALESLGNLIHNETANLLAFPGQTGSNARINLPEELHGRERHLDALQCAMVQLAKVNPGLGAQLRLPFLEVNQARWLVEEVMERINQRVDHELEGWLEAGLTTVDFELPGVGLIPSKHYLALAPEKQAAINAAANPVVRRLSPREVFDAGRRKLVRLRPEQVAALLLVSPNAGREVTVGRDHLICFDDASVSPAPLRFLAHHFAPGDKFRGVCNPASPNTLFLFDARGAWVGQVQAWQAVSHLDADGLHAAMGRAAKVEKELLAPLASRGAALTRQRLDDARHNADVLRQPGRAQVAEAAKLRRVEGGMEELAAVPAAAGDGPSEENDFSAEGLL